MSEIDEKHTPGPWEITSISQNTGNIGIGHKEQHILIAEVTNAASFGDMLVGAMRRGGGGFEQDDCHTQFANARLIAAAPDMAQAIRDTIACRSDTYRAGNNRQVGIQGDDGEKCWIVPFDQMAALEAALAKALSSIKEVGK